MKKLILVLVVALLTALIAIIPAPVKAQDGTPIFYGDTVEGEITNATFEVPYLFEGKAGDIVVIVLTPGEEQYDFSQPQVILLDSSGALLGDGSGFTNALLFTELPADGKYTILATRADGRTGTSVGTYTLSLFNPTPLVPGEPVSGSVTSETTAYFTISDFAEFTLTYEKTAGDFAPSIQVQTYDEFEDLSSVATLEGSLLTRGSLGVAGDAAINYLVKVTSEFFFFSFEETTADFTLTLEAAE